MPMYICEICKKAPATVHLTDIHNNQKKELHLCQECAEAKGLSYQTSFSLPDLLAGMSKAKQEDGHDPNMVCSVCGLTYNEFQARGRFGCAHDYTEFHSEVLPMIERIHGQSRHIGKTPHRGELPAEERRLLDMQRRMREAVDNEAYEEAAELRDQIAQLRQEIDNERG